jgi:hypothetical protein
MPSSLNDLRIEKIMMKVSKLEDEASQIGYAEVELLARIIMQQHKEITCFCMCMGSASFHEGSGVAGVIDDTDERVTAMTTFIDKWNDDLHLTGMPLKLDSADGEVITNW